MIFVPSCNKAGPVGTGPGRAGAGWSPPFYFGCTTVWATYIARYRVKSAEPARRESLRAPPQKDTDMSIAEFIANEVKSNDVVLFMKGTPQFPQCGFSGQVVQILDHIG